MTRGIAAIAIGYSAYMAEIFRARIEAIPKGQIEASRALGLRERLLPELLLNRKQSRKFCQRWAMSLY
jgi:ABC-type amino acid transport system, permease component